MTIPIFRPSCTQAEIDAVTDVLRSGWWGMGPKTEEFERRFAEYVRTPYAVAVNSCTAALDLAMRIIGIGPGDEVIVPTITFVSTAHVVAKHGAMPVFADVEYDNLNIDPADVARKITPRTKAIIPVHYGGRMCDMSEMEWFHLEHGVAIVEDAAHACGASWHRERAGTLGSVGCFSFHAVKNLACGDGGMIVSNDKEYIRTARADRWLGIDKSTWERTDANKDYHWQYNVTSIGEKCHMNDITAALGLAQLERLPAMNARRKEIVAAYFAAFADLPLDLPLPDDDVYQSSWHIFHVKTDRRDDLHRYLAERGISTGVHYYPIHLYSVYGNRPSLPVAESVWPKLLTLPLFPDMTDGEMHQVIEGVRGFYGK